MVKSGSQESDGFSTHPSTPSDTPKTSKGSGKRVIDDQNTGTRKAAARLKEKCSSHIKVEDQLLKEATLALKSATSQQHVDQESDQDMLYGKWLSGELKQITDVRAKQLLKIKIQNLLFEAQFGESVLEQIQPQMHANFAAPQPSHLSNGPTPSHGPQNWASNNFGSLPGPTYTNL